LGLCFLENLALRFPTVRRQRSRGKEGSRCETAYRSTRYTHDEVLITHDRERIPCRLWDIEEPLNTFLPCFRESDCIVIEEAQFFRNLKNAVMWLLRAHQKSILIVGLDADAHQEKFGEIMDCIPWANTVVKLQALCSISSVTELLLPVQN
jgi:thymidine kinase